MTYEKKHQFEFKTIFFSYFIFIWFGIAKIGESIRENSRYTNFKGNFLFYCISKYFLFNFLFLLNLLIVYLLCVVLLALVEKSIFTQRLSFFYISSFSMKYVCTRIIEWEQRNSFYISHNLNFVHPKRNVFDEKWIFFV